MKVAKKAAKCACLRLSSELPLGKAKSNTINRTFLANNAPSICGVYQSELVVVAAAWLLQAAAGLLVGLRVTCRVTSVEDLYKRCNQGQSFRLIDVYSIQALYIGGT